MRISAAQSKSRPHLQQRNLVASPVVMSLGHYAELQLHMCSRSQAHIQVLSRIFPISCGRCHAEDGAVQTWEMLWDNAEAIGATGQWLSLSEAAVQSYR